MITNYIKSLKSPLKENEKISLREIICNVISLYNNENLYSSIIDLCMVREVIFEEDKVQPEQLHPHFVDFMIDENMWEFIVKIKDRGKSLNSDKIGLGYLMADLKDCLDKKEIFI